MALTFTPVTIMDSGGMPIVNDPNGAPMTVSNEAGIPVTLVEDFGLPVNLLWPDGEAFDVPFGATFYADFVNGRYWDGSVTNFATATDFTRASAGLADTVAGVWSSFATDVARITDRGIRIEPASTNLILHFDCKTGMPLSATGETANVVDDGVDNSVTDPFGAVGARKVTVSNTGTGAVGLRIGATSGGVAGTNYVGSIWIRTADGSSKTLNLDVNDTTPETVVVVDSEWQRVSAGNSHPTQPWRFFDIAFRAGDDGEYHLFGAQLEAGRLTPTAPITTTTATATRAVDALTILASGTNDWTVTYDDDSTEEFAGVSGNFEVDPSAIDRAVIKSIAGFPA